MTMLDEHVDVMLREWAETRPVPETPQQHRRRMLTNLAEWLGAQETRRRLGLSSDWDQQHWIAIDSDGNREVWDASCGAAACLAGRTILDAGYEALRSEDFEYVERCRLPGEMETRSIPVVAAELLGITSDESDALFHGDNTYEDCVRIVAWLLDSTYVYSPSRRVTTDPGSGDEYDPGENYWFVKDQRELSSSL